MLILSASEEQLREIRQNAMDRKMEVAVYIKQMFQTSNDEDNRAEVKKYRDSEYLYPV